MYVNHATKLGQNWANFKFNDLITWLIIQIRTLSYKSVKYEPTPPDTHTWWYFLRIIIIWPTNPSNPIWPLRDGLRGEFKTSSSHFINPFWTVRTLPGEVLLILLLLLCTCEIWPCGEAFKTVNGDWGADYKGGAKLKL